MSAKKESTTTVILTGNDYDFSASATLPLFDGYTRIYGENEEEKKTKLPKDVKIGDPFESENVEKTQHFTKAPAR